MAERNKPSRRDFLKLAGLGGLAGAGFGVVTYKQSPPEPAGQLHKPSIGDVLPPVLNPETQEGYIATCTALGAILVPAGHRMLTGNNPPADVGRHEREVGEEFYRTREEERLRQRAQDQADPRHKDR